MAIQQGQQALASDFIASSAGAVDAGKGVKTDGNGKIDASILFPCIKKSFVLGEAVLRGHAVVLGDGITGEPGNSSVAGSTNYQYMSNIYWYAQRFVTTANARSIISVKVKFGRSGGGTNFSTPYYIDICSDNGGVPGQSIGHLGSFMPWTNGATVYTVTATTAVPVNPGTNYFVVVYGSYYSGWQWIGNNSGGAGAYSSTDFANWNPSNGPLYYEITEVWNAAGQVYKADATKAASHFRLANFIGFADASGNQGDSIPISIAGADANQSGLLAGQIYYISNTPGVISTAAGTTPKKIGIAMSATEILIKHDNPS